MLDSILAMTILDWLALIGALATAIPILANPLIFILRKAGKNDAADWLTVKAPLVANFLARNPEKIAAVAAAATEIRSLPAAGNLAVKIAGMKLEEAVPESVAKPPSVGVPPVVLPVFVLVACATVLCGCAQTAKLVEVVEAGRDIAAVAEPCLVEQRDAALGKCTDKACTDAINAAFDPIADAFDVFRAGWCMVSPTSEGCAK